MPDGDTPGKGYHRHITFSDNSMVRLLELLREVTSAGTYGSGNHFENMASKNACMSRHERWSASAS